LDRAGEGLTVRERHILSFTLRAPVPPQP
jgi:hypothetical protein